jgi:DNA-binding transcriptional LysR family regulator
MELRHLRYFVAVAEELNFSRAAERLHIAQPPLSVQIRTLEAELGALLLERDKRQVSLTQAGREFLDQSRAILLAADGAKARARSAANGVVGQLILGYTASSMFNAVLPHSIRAFRKAYPQVALTFREMGSLDQLDALHERVIDLGVLRKPDTNTVGGLSIEPWYAAPLVVAMADDHPLAGKHAVSVKDLRADAFIMYPRDAGIGLYWRVMELCRAAGFRPEVAQQVREASTIVGLVAAGAGVAIVPQDTRCIQLGGVVYKCLIDALAVSALHLAYRTDNPDQHVANLTRLLTRNGRDFARKSAKRGAKPPLE